MTDVRVPAWAVLIALSAARCASPSTTPAASSTPSTPSTAGGEVRQEHAEHDDEESVRPGVNDPYFRIDALGRYTDILEAEHREVVKYRDAIVAEIGLRPGMFVADIGAGTGLFTNAIAEVVGPTGRVFAVDIVPVFLKRIEERAREANLAQVKTVLGEEQTTTLPPHSVDLAFMCDTYHHLEYPKSYLRSVFENLRPDGSLVLIDFERIEGKTWSSRLDHVRAGKQTVIEEVTGAGFVLDKEIDLLTDNYYLRFTKR